MDLEIKRQWVDALRSGEYVQGKGRLRTPDGRYCCLGVLCDLASKRGVGSWYESDIDEFVYRVRGTHTDTILPAIIASWAQVPNEDPKIPSPGEEPPHTLSYLNDMGSTFAEIASHIE